MSLIETKKPKYCQKRSMERMLDSVIYQGVISGCELIESRTAYQKVKEAFSVPGISFHESIDMLEASPEWTDFFDPHYFKCDFLDEWYEVLL